MVRAHFADDSTAMQLLDSDDLRGQAALYLKHSFDDQAGEALIRALIKETDNSVKFSVFCYAVLPKWIVPLERQLSKADEWPLNANQTAWLFKLCKGWRLPSLEQRLDTCLKSDDWALALAAVMYSYETLIMTQKARLTCSRFLSHKFAAVDKERITRTLHGGTFGKLKRRIRRMERVMTPSAEECPNYV